MIFTDQMLAVYKTAYPFIQRFQPELLKAEAWLVSNPDRVPEKRWGTFVNNWMRIANEIAKRVKGNLQQGHNNAEGYLSLSYKNYEMPGHNRTGKNKAGALSLGEILNKARGKDDDTSKDSLNTPTGAILQPQLTGNTDILPDAINGQSKHAAALLSDVCGGKKL